MPLFEVTVEQTFVVEAKDEDDAADHVLGILNRSSDACWDCENVIDVEEGGK
ncbi:MAG: hypothetical protein PHR28_09225 [candidate division Zixibacteria bacterium]|jgi:hypothetical protein|nr:hypothetical protein [candidate division Zixibacteria bacterium]